MRLREIKKRHHFSPKFETKWAKVSQSKLRFYMDLVDYFFDDNDLHFRALVVPDKSLLNHKAYGQDHDTWYYKMYFDMLKVILHPSDRYQIYLDIKDTRGGQKVQKLQKVLCNNIYDFSRSIIQTVQIVRSHEVEILQMADLLAGALSYLHRDLNTSDAKTKLIQRIRERSGYSLTKTTLLSETKFNLFIWRASEPTDQ